MGAIVSAVAQLIWTRKPLTLDPISEGGSDVGLTAESLFPGGLGKNVPGSSLVMVYLISIRGEPSKFKLMQFSSERSTIHSILLSSCALNN